MYQTIVRFILPLAICEAGQYKIQLNGKTAEISLNLIQTNEKMDKLTGWVSEGKISMIPDPHGTVNVTDVTIRFPYSITTSPELIKQECIIYLNRLVEVVRYYTQRYWTPLISGRDIQSFAYKIVDDQGKGTSGNFMDNGAGFEVAIPLNEESNVKSKIHIMLQNDAMIIPSFENLILDAYNYYSAGRFNECVIVMNIALEEFVQKALYFKLIHKENLSAEEVDKRISRIFSQETKQKKTGLHRVMTVDLMEIDGRSLEDNSELWNNFNIVRTIRKNAVHPRTTLVGLPNAEFTIRNIIDIMHWVESSPAASTAKGRTDEQLQPDSAGKSNDM